MIILSIYLVGVILAYFTIGIANVINKTMEKKSGWAMFFSWVAVVYCICLIIPDPEDSILWIKKLFKKKRKPLEWDKPDYHIQENGEIIFTLNKKEAKKFLEWKKIQESNSEHFECYTFMFTPTMSGDKIDVTSMNTFEILNVNNHK